MEIGNAVALVPHPEYHEISLIIPAHNEEGCIAATLESIRRQLVPPGIKITTYVVNDGSTDKTAEVVEKFPEVVLITPDRKQGSKAKAQNFALFAKEGDEYVVKGDVIVTIDADTSLLDDALMLLCEPVLSGKWKASCGTVIPANLDNPFTLGRLGEYLFAFALPKRVQNSVGGIYIVSGCFGAYEATTLRAMGGWLTATMAEDMDLTARYAQNGHLTGYVADAICRPIEPFDYKTFSAQMKRWSAAFFQNLSAHWKTYMTHKLGLFAFVSYLDAGSGGILYLILPLLMFVMGWVEVLEWLLIGDVAMIAAPVLIMALTLRGRIPHIMRYAIMSIPFIFFLRYLNIWFWFRALWLEWICKDHLGEYVKGH